MTRRNVSLVATAVWLVGAVVLAVLAFVDGRTWIGAAWVVIAVLVGIVVLRRIRSAPDDGGV